MKIKKIYKIKGMDCPSCAKSIEKAVKNIEGVSDANINYASEKMFVESEKEIDDKTIMESVENTGFRSIKIFFITNPRHRPWRPKTVIF